MAAIDKDGTLMVPSFWLPTVRTLEAWLLATYSTEFEKRSSNPQPAIESRGPLGRSGNYTARKKSSEGF